MENARKSLKTTIGNRGKTLENEPKQWNIDENWWKNNEKTTRTKQDVNLIPRAHLPINSIVILHSYVNVYQRVKFIALCQAWLGSFERKYMALRPTNGVFLQGNVHNL